MWPLLALSACLAISDVRNVRRQNDLHAANMANALATAVNQDLQARIGALSMLASSPLAADASRWADLYKEAQGFKQSFGSHVILAGLDLQMRFNTRVPFGTALPSLPRPKTRAAVPLAIETGKAAVGDVFMGPIAQQSLVAVAVPVLRNGKVEGVLLSTFETRQLERHLETLALPPAWSLSLLDSGDAVIAHRGPAQPATAASVATNEAAEGFGAAIRTTPWRVRLNIPREAYLSPLLDAGGLLAIGLAAATLTGVIGGTLAGRRLSREVATLAQPSGEAGPAPSIAEIAAVRRLLDEAEARREASEATLRKSEQRFRRLFQESPLPMALMDREGAILDLNARFVQVLGFTREDIRTAEDWWRLAYPDRSYREENFAGWQAAVDKVGASPSPIAPLERRIRCKDGRTRDMVVSGIRIDGDFLSTLFDITERKHEESSRQRLAAIVRSSDDAIISKTLDGIIESWNPGAEKLFGYTAEEALGRPMTLVIPPDRQNEEEDILQRIRSGRTVQSFETVRLRKDGSEVHVSATISPIHDDRGHVIGASKIARDVSQRRQAERHLQDQVERLHLLDQITTAIGERQDLGSIYQVVLRRLEERLPVDLACVLEPGDGPDGLGVLRIGPCSGSRAWQLGLIEGQKLELAPQVLARCQAGELVQMPDTADASSLFAHRLADGGLRSLVLAPMASDKGLISVLAVARTAPRAFSQGDGEFLRQLSAHVGLAARQARLYGALQLAYDELRQTQQAVMQQERLRALGEMASGVAHDINNAISPVLLLTEALLAHEPDLSPRARGHLETVARSIDDVAATVARLREFYRQREPDLQLSRVAVAPLLRQVMELTRARWHDMPLERGVVIQATLEAGEDLPEVMAVESELREALTNLVFNAVDAMPEGGRLELRARLREAGNGPAGVELEVADNGLGMDEQTRRRCMEPFFTTKGERGTGLGLAMVYGILRRHGAELLIDSQAGVGTRMRLLFPAAGCAGAASATRELVAPSQPLRLLVVDDDPLVLASLCETLRADGHQVRPADGGQAAIDAFLAEPPFDAVITDLGMPYLDGRQLARAIKHHASATPVILVTGWGQRLIDEGELPQEVDRVLGKPPKLRELRAALAELVPPPPS